MALAEPADDLRSQAHTHLALVRAWGLQGDDQRALLHAVHALRLFQVLDNPAWQANALSQVGWFHGQLGHHAQARVYCEAALTLHRQHHNSASEAVTLDSLGHIAHRTGRYGQAVEYFQQALVLFRHLGDSYDEADTLDHLGRAHAALAHNDRACRAWSHALTRYQGQHRTADVERIRLQLAAIDQHWPHHLTATVDDHPDTPANGLARTGRTAT
jgi:tetratricopeptide (TPR) repeat protein